MNRLSISAFALVLSSGAALAGNSYWVPCHYVTTPKGTITTLDYSQFANDRYQYDGPTSGISVSKGLIACTHCGRTSYTYDKGVLDNGNHGGGETSSHSVSK
jgi:hypothetical protein